MNSNISGKATSRSFIERIPSFFDQRKDAWFNTLSKRIMVSGAVKYTKTLKKGLSLRVVLFGIKSNLTAIKLEGVL